MEIVAPILRQYAVDLDNAQVRNFGSGLINSTWKLREGDRKFILQKINEKVFSKPWLIERNVQLIGDYLKEHYPDYLFVYPVKSLRNEEMVFHEELGYFRMFPFVEGSSTFDVVETSGQAYEAARQFGRFTKLLSGFDASQLKLTIPGFHDLSARYDSYLNALHNGDHDRIRQSQDLIEAISAHKNIVDDFEAIKTDSGFRIRVMHHDTKISNVLFDEEERGLCVIDLDTVMPGYFISDVGDMMRTYLSPVSEEETDLEWIEVRDDFYMAIRAGYLEEMQDELTQAEKEHFSYAGRFMIYMQALRFLTDHLMNDVYYGAKYEGHNYNRAANQVRLLQCLVAKEKQLVRLA